MCGINGGFAYHYAANPFDFNELLRTRDHMVTRGPDSGGAWMSDDGRIGFGHRRLSIIDLSDAGSQPMANADASLIVTFNGEIYNYRDLREALELKGYVFRSNSDTEVLLHLYADKGEAMVLDLRGMFAFAIWDEKKKSLFLARDRFGIKPLYFADDGWTFRFASQVKALVAGGAVAPDPDPAGLAGFYLFGSVPEPFTIYRTIRTLPAGCTMMVGSAGPERERRYYTIAQAYRDAVPARPPTEETLRRARAAVSDSVSKHLIADVPVGIFLSAGVDSGALLGLMRDAGMKNIQAVTVNFDEFVGSTADESLIASELARKYGAQHTVRTVRRAEFDEDLPSIIEAMDQPSIDGVNTWFASKAARELGLKVVISGLGGDELLGGYPSFRDIPNWTRLMWAPSRVPLLGRAVRMALTALEKSAGLNPKTAGLVELGGTTAGSYLLKRGLFLPWELQKVMTPDLLAEGLRRLMPMNLIEGALTPDPGSDFARVATLETSFYMRNQLLRDTDFASMAHSIEVRVPLVDHVLLSELASFHGDFGPGAGKSLLASAPREPLPDHVLNRSKTGFQTPVHIWMQSAAHNEEASSGPWARNWSRVVLKNWMRDAAEKQSIAPQVAA